MNINVLVTGGLYDTQAGFSALRFCQAALQAGHIITQVFFYQQGVLHANRLASPLADEFDATAQWIELAEHWGVSLAVCTSAAERRGILSVEQASETGKSGDNMHPAFTVAGLGVLHEASMSSERTVIFK